MGCGNSDGQVATATLMSRRERLRLAGGSNLDVPAAAMWADGRRRHVAGRGNISGPAAATLAEESWRQERTGGGSNYRRARGTGGGRVPAATMVGLRRNRRDGDKS